jgi:type II protein arginine methyltransferase
MLVGNLKLERYRMDEIMGFDLSPFNTLGPKVITTPAGGGRFDAFSETVELFQFDLKAGTYQERERRDLALPIIRAGEVQGFMQWNWMDFGAGLIFENRPPRASCWVPVIHLFPQGLAVQPGEVMHLVAEHDLDRIVVWQETG